jgi:hypothetical protein
MDRHATDRDLLAFAKRIVEARGPAPELDEACKEFEAFGCDPALELYGCIAAMQLEEDVFADANLADDAYVASVVLLRREASE